MTTRKEEQERRRAERLAADQRESSAARRRLMAGYIVAGALGLAVIVGLVLVLAGGDEDPTSSGDFPENAHVQAQSGSVNDFELDDREGTEPPAVAQANLDAAAEAAGCELQLELRDEGNTHLDASAEVPEYETSPPTSGDHVNPPLQQADGAYAEQVGDIYAVHALEHGRIAIQYSPDLSEDEQLEIKGIFDESPAGALLYPNPDMPWAVAATGWTQLIGCEAYEGAATLDAIRAFRDIYRGQAPEDVPLITG